MNSKLALFTIAVFSSSSFAGGLVHIKCSFKSESTKELVVEDIQHQTIHIIRGQLKKEEIERLKSSTAQKPVDVEVPTTAIIHDKSSKKPQGL